MSVNQLLLLLLALSATFAGWRSQPITIEGGPSGAPAGVVAMATPTPTPLPTPEAVDAALLAKGKAIYLSQYCGICHMLTAAETRAILGLPTTTWRHLPLSGSRTASTRARRRRWKSICVKVSSIPTRYFVPGAANGRHPMPSYAHLPEADIDALIYLLMQQK